MIAMDTLKELLGELRPGRVLDIATGSGAFARRLAESVASYGELVAVDSARRAVDAAAKNLAELRNARAELGDASALPYPDGSFDLVGIANSLHHFAAPGRAIAEAGRVLAPGGVLAVLEMHRDAETEAERTHALLHRWWAEIDRAGGAYHDEPFPRARFRELLGGEGFAEVRWGEERDLESDPKDPELMDQLAGTFAAYRAKIATLAEDDRRRLLAEGEELEARAKETGFRSAPSIVFAARKATR